MAESNGRRNGQLTGMAGMAERQKEWQNSRMAEMATYVLFMVHTEDDTDNDTDDNTNDNNVHHRGGNKDTSSNSNGGGKNKQQST